MIDIDKEILKHRKALKELQILKAKQSAKKPKSENPVGRPPIEPEKLKIARTLAKEFPIPDVARRLNISLSSLYRAGIKRYLLNREKRKIL